MPLKVLLADDNITAQKMGSKILSDAGHTVVAVSNGAAAVKKIASEKPQLLILDVYMPGYSGLEVCEKVKNTPETARIPVLLTFTNMEPFSPEQGYRVKADGVLVKPFEATDLIAVVQKLEEKMHAAPAPNVDTEKIAVDQEFDQAEWKAEAEPAKVPGTPEMSAEVASAPLMGVEELQSGPSTAPAAAATSAPTPRPAQASAAPVKVEDETAEISAFSVNAPTPAFHVEDAQAAAGPSPVEAPPPELEPTSAPSTGAIEVATAAELEVTGQEATDDVAVVPDPALATDPSDFAQFVTRFGGGNAEDITVGVAMEQPPTAAPAEHLTGPLVENVPPEPPTGQWDVSEVRHSLGFSMRAAAAAAPAPEPQSEAGMETQPLDAFAEPELPRAGTIEAEPAYSNDNTETLVAQFVAELEAAQAEGLPQIEPAPPPEAPPQIEPAPQPDMEPPAAAATNVMMNDQHIAETVDRVLERYKNELIAAIVRELKS